MNGWRRLLPRRLARWYRRRQRLQRFLRALAWEVEARRLAIEPGVIDRTIEAERERFYAELVREINDRTDGLLQELDRRIEALAAEVAALREGREGSNPGPPNPVRSSSPVTPEVDLLVAEALPPSGAPIQLDLLYRLLLRRPIEEEKLRAGGLALAAGQATRADLAKWIVESPEFAEIELIEKTLAVLGQSATPFATDEKPPIGPGTTERVVEIPWALSRWRGEERVLDVGYAYAAGYYLTALLGLPIAHLHGVDWSAAPLPGMLRTRADLRSLPYRDDAFDLVICISTIEHVGMDNARYGLEGHQGVGGDVAALRELERIVGPGGRILVTVPFGRREDHDWFVQYDSARWEDLVRSTGLREQERDLFELTEDGWVKASSVRRLERLSYGIDAPAARAVLCASLIRPNP